MVKPENQRCEEEAEDNEAIVPFDQAHIDVIPLDVDGGYALCEMEPHTAADAIYLRNGHITLPRGRPVEIHFRLKNGKDDAYKYLQFDARPWSFEARRCPDSDDNDNGKFPLARRVNSKRLAVVTAPSANPNWGHFRLNFELGVSWDPIIIRD